MNNSSIPNDYRAFDPFNYTCSEALLLPIISEATWNPGVRAFLYILALLWCFLAVAIIADVFMCSIEKITSKTRKIRVADSSVPEGYKELEVKVWNDTVANLSLLALGTSAPEILLSVIEIVGNNFKAGDLGPGTIVGSAAFNLLVISAICIMSIPGGDVRRINNMKVFAVTAFSCIFAYVWLIITLVAISPGKIEIWEAFLTLLFFPLLIIIAFIAEKDFCMKKKPPRNDSGFVGISLNGASNKYTVNDTENARALEGNPEEQEALDQSYSGRASIYRIAKDLAMVEDLPEDEAAKIAAKKIVEHQHHDRGWYRINAIRNMSGGKKLIPKVLNTFDDLYNRVQLPEEERDEATVTKRFDHSEGGTKPVIEFTASAVAVLENEGKVRIGIRRSGKIDVPISVRVETINGTALEGSDYKAFDEVVSFAANELLRQVYIEIVDDFEWEPDEFFFVKLAPVPSRDQEFALGNLAICQVTIINDDEPGTLDFAKPSIIAKESSRRIRIPVQRLSGADGHVSVTWRTKDMTAFDGKDFEGGEGELKFDNGETSKSIDLVLFPSNKPERDDSFQVELLETTGGAKLGRLTKTVVTIVNDEEFNGLVSRIVNMTFGNLDGLALEDSTYISQFKNAMNVNGGDIEGATFVDYILHFLTFVWKIIFAFIPPVHILGGWPTFVISLGMIGFLTALIGDLASLFGCLIGLEDSITAITLVALGTSMPDTFASKTAAIMERYADSSVGNVTGSNSVNVFLGLGIPWVIASIYWHTKGLPFEVPVGSLVFSVILYTIAAVIALSILVIRRNVKCLGNAELGGPTVGKIVCGIIFITLWVLYVLFSALQAKKVINVQI
ncbi:sodium/calcium exchanger 3 isoform X2 [Patella vulgata]|uniref:sodium/calcium exchanger 3 isoform X2 n=1 Tax=Patella vulgata TaxID=6465 RepID=UPI002180911F|nr:sodium/calcium exchanger 3 isoform X2 [Patella vulgata]